MRLHIRRLVVDASALGTLTHEQLRAQMQAAFARGLSGTAAAAGHVGAFADHAAEAIAPHVRAPGTPPQARVRIRSLLDARAGAGQKPP